MVLVTRNVSILKVRLIQDFTTAATSTYSEDLYRCELSILSNKEYKGTRPNYEYV